MDQLLLDYVKEKTYALMEAPSCSKEAKAAAQSWLQAIGTDQEGAATASYIAALEQAIMPIDMLIQFAGSDAGVKVFGEDTAKKISAHAVDIKAKGAVYCDCPACSAVAAILEKKEQLL